MLKKIYDLIIPDFLKWKIREISPYYHRFLELQKQADQNAADFRSQLDASQQQIQKKNEECAALTISLQKKNEELANALKAYQKKSLDDFHNYQASLKHIFQDPSVREDHLCGICGQRMQYSFSRKIMNKYDISYFYCSACDHIQTEKPYWLAEAYESPLSDSDTGQVWRNERNRDTVCAFAHRFMQQPPKVLEYAAGYGLLTRMLRDSGMECFWYDKYSQNVFARHFEDDGKRAYDLVLAFEALEHFEDPMMELETIFKRGTSLLFSEVLLTEPCPNQWWYLCTEHGQHINFYSRKTLQYIADHFHKNLYIHEDTGLLTSMEIKQEDFDEMFDHIEEYVKKFRETAHPLMLEDMDTVINKTDKLS